MAQNPSEILSIGWSMKSTGHTMSTQSLTLTPEGKAEFEETFFDVQSPNGKETTKKRFDLSPETFSDLAGLVVKANFFSAAKRYKTTCPHGPDILAQPGSDTITLTVTARRGKRAKTHSTQATYVHLGDQGGFPPEILKLSQKLRELATQLNSPSP